MTKERPMLLPRRVMAPRKQAIRRRPEDSPSLSQRERAGMTDRGYLVVTVAILLVILLGLSALAVDVGMMYSARTSAQRAADAAALAGAFTFVVEPNAPQPATAIQHAQQTALTNKILGDPIAAGDLTINVDVPNRLVTVACSMRVRVCALRGRGRTFATLV